MSYIDEASESLDDVKLDNKNSMKMRLKNKWCNQNATEMYDEAMEQWPMGLTIFYKNNRIGEYKLTTSVW